MQLSVKCCRTTTVRPHTRGVLPPDAGAVLLTSVNCFALVTLLTVRFFGLRWILFRLLRLSPFRTLFFDTQERVRLSADLLVIFGRWRFGTNPKGHRGAADDWRRSGGRDG